MDFYLKRFTSLFFIISILFLTGCSEPNKFEAVLPDKSETCGGRAIPSRYIVHFKAGHWDYIENSNRENFRDHYVVQNYNEIDFIEYDQLITVNDFAQKPAADVRRPSSIKIQAQTGIDNWGAAAIEAPAAWQAGNYGEGVVIAVVDTGVDITHSQLATQIAYNEGEGGPKKNNGIDDDGNGFVDDYAGYNFVNNSADVADDVDHGTHISGIIAAAHNDTSVHAGYVQGVAPKAKILPVKFLAQDGGTLSAALKGIDYAISRGAKVINASWGGPGCSTSLRQKVVEVAKNNVLFVSAAGNSGANLDRNPEYPAAFDLPLQITVGALTPSLNMTDFSNYSETLVHVFAPGSAIVSTVPGNQYAAMNGTSMAAPFVSGVAALLLAQQPDITVSELRAQILDATVHDSNLMSSTQGRLNIRGAGLGGLPGPGAPASFW